MFSAGVQPSHCRIKQDGLQKLPLPVCTHNIWCFGQCKLMEFKLERLLQSINT